MAQLTGTTGRSIARFPVAFVAGTLVAVAAMATVIILGLALGLEVGLRNETAAAQAAPAVSAQTYDGRLDPIEADYIRDQQRQRRVGTGSAGRDLGTAIGAPKDTGYPYIAPAPREGLIVATQDGGILYTGIPYLGPTTDRSAGSNGTRFAQ